MGAENAAAELQSIATAPLNINALTRIDANLRIAYAASTRLIGRAKGHPEPMENGGRR